MNSLSEPTVLHSDLPTVIEGDEQLKTSQRNICMKYIDCFNRKLKYEAALVPPMEVDLTGDIRFDTRGNRLHEYKVG